MDFNYTLRYRSFNQLLEDVSVDFNTFALENMIEPQQLIKLAKKLNYDLGLRINQTKEVILEVCHGKVKLPDDFYVFNYAMLCGEYTVNTGYDMGGTNIQEVPYVEVPWLTFCTTTNTNSEKFAESAEILICRDPCKSFGCHIGCVLLGEK